LQVEKNGNTLIVLPTGEIDFGNSHQLKDAIKERLDASIQGVLMDLSRVSFIDSTGAAVFISLIKILTPRKGELVACSLQEDVRFVFSASRLDSILQIFPSRQQALEYLKARDM